ncbi:indole-3-glycerol phosphate synthase TrpC [Pseudoramibacter porci]|uniref:Indole-3-glycerol phosphate synthase n=1 Tax=Pseudoramibacter porci TaxID=2606631 RepID=A0A7X2T9K7_9FIRM|nr:indole-3-glycerol phosphate synthase TrpC [Pseudoramibacter porci]MSS18908.1 indole-3-glycerol phosphate synthase TrpC [Pseudoramibacter porci]
MKNILDQLADHARARVAEAKTQVSAAAMREAADSLAPGHFEFEQALKKPGLAFICECKKASPSKGLIAPDFPYLDIAKAYETAGADAISCLTEPKWFLGQDAYLEEIVKNVKIPVLRKDFTVDDYMIDQAKVMGASAVLLIVAITEPEELRRYLKRCDALGLSAVVEAHDAAEIQTALAAGARIVGVNNRNLKDFSVNTDNSRALRDLVPEDVAFISESGVKTPEDVENIRAFGADAVLVGEALMRAADKTAALKALKGEA